MAPAHVPQMGFSLPNALRGSIKLKAVASFPMVVDSPPGIISPSRPSRCSGRRTSTASTPMRRSMAMCSMKAPCNAKTPILIDARCIDFRLPASPGDQFRFWHRRNLAAYHWLTQVAADFSKNVRIIVMGGRLDNGCCTTSRIAGLEDARADKHTVHAQLHHQGGVCRSGDASGGEIHHRQTSKAARLHDQFIWSADLL